MYTHNAHIHTYILLKVIEDHLKYYRKKEDYEAGKEPISLMRLSQVLYVQSIINMLYCLYIPLASHGHINMPRASISP